MKKEHLFDVKTLTMMGLLTALEIILSRFCSFSAWNVKIGFAFLPVVLCAIMLGPLQAGLVGAMGDFIGAILFPIGTYFPGFTATAFLTGLIFGLFLHKKQSVPRILGAVAINQLAGTLLLNTFWISVLYGAPYGALLTTRLLQVAILAPTQFVLIGTITKTLGRYSHRKAIA